MKKTTNLQQVYLDILTELEQEPALNRSEGFSEELKSLRRRMEDDVFRIAVVGAFSSGKSTFINAILGRDLLSHATKETTAVLTRIINVAEDDVRRGTGTVYMRDGMQEELPTLDALKEYTTTVSKTHEVVKEVKVVDIYRPLLHAEHPLMLIDTPGLNGIASGHLEQTVKVVQEAHACIYLIQQRGLTKEDIAFLKEKLVPYQRDFIFVQNFIDEFKEHEGETVEGRLELIEKNLREQVFPVDDWPIRLCGVSALKELAARDENIKYLYAGSDEPLDDAARERLGQESGFVSFRAIMAQEFDDERLETMQYESTAHAIEGWSRGLLQKIERRLEEAHGVYEVSKERGALEKLERLRLRLLESKEGNLLAIDGFVSSKMRYIRKQLEILLEEGIQKTEQKTVEQLEGCRTEAEIEEMRKNLARNMKNELQVLQQDISEDCREELHLLNQLIVERIEEYSGIRSKSQNIRQLQVGSLPSPSDMRVEDDGLAARHQQRIARGKQQEEAMRHQLGQNRSAMNQAQGELRHWESEAQQAQQEIRKSQAAVQHMGQRPAERVWRERHKVKRTGIFGSILDLISTKTEVRTMRDDSAGEAWDRERRRMAEQQNVWVKEYDDKLAEKRRAERAMERLRAEAQENEARLRRIEEEIRKEQEDLAKAIEIMEKRKRDAEEAYLRKCRSHLCSQVRNYLHGIGDEEGEKQRLANDWQETLKKSSKDLQEKARQMYEESMEQKLELLEQAKERETPQLQHEIEELAHAQKTLEDCIERMGMEERTA